MFYSSPSNFYIPIDSVVQKYHKKIEECFSESGIFLRVRDNYKLIKQNKKIAEEMDNVHNFPFKAQFLRDCL